MQWAQMAFLCCHTVEAELARLAKIVMVAVVVPVQVAKHHALQGTPPEGQQAVEKIPVQLACCMH